MGTGTVWSNAVFLKHIIFTILLMAHGLRNSSLMRRRKPIHKETGMGSQTQKGYNQT